jgi:pimeloyl-ACP methyl ester carboxylesterase
VEQTIGNWFADPEQAVDGVAYVRRTVAGTQPEGYALACEALAEADATDAVSRVTAPVLVLHGEKEPPPFHAAAQWLAATLPSAEVVRLPRTAHAPALEDPPAVAQALRAFLAS